MGNTQHWRNWINTFCITNGAKHYEDSINDQYVFGPCRHVTMNEHILCVVDGSLRVSMFFRDILLINQGMDEYGKTTMNILARANITFTV